MLFQRMQFCRHALCLNGMGHNLVVMSASCAGYNVCCPFLPPNVEVLKEDKPQLLLNVVHPRAPGIFFLGFVQAHGPMIPCVEGQMPWVADLIQACPSLLAC